MTIGNQLGVPSPNTFLMPEAVACANPTLILGMELETENCGRSGDWYRANLEELGWQVDRDSSLRGSGAYEFISKPMQTQHLLASLEKYFKLTKFTTSNYSDRCSTHVHVNCTDLTNDHLSSLALVYAIFEECLFDFIGANRGTNLYCIPWNQCRHNYNLLQKIKDSLIDTPKGWQKYTALNLAPLSTYGTVEFRHMHGTSDLGKLEQWLNIIGCLFRYIKETSLEEIMQIVLNINTVSNYEGFFNSVFQGYWKYAGPLSEMSLKLEEGVISTKYALVSPLGGQKVPTVRNDDYMDTTPAGLTTEGLEAAITSLSNMTRGRVTPMLGSALTGRAAGGSIIDDLFAAPEF